MQNTYNASNNLINVHIYIFFLFDDHTHIDTHKYIFMRTNILYKYMHTERINIYI
jgi:hypothetical protein